MTEDVDSIMAVMTAAFDPRYGEAWSRRQVEDALVLGNCHYQLAAPPFASPETPCAGFFLSRTGYEEEELLLLAVVPQFRRFGLASQLLTELARDAAERGAQRLLLEMRRGNPAERLYRTFGFHNIGERKDYYRLADGTRVDAITFAAELSPPRVHL